MDGLDEGEQRVVGDIARFGWHLIQVTADAEGPGFTYSIGMMQTLDHPEVIIFGLEGKLMAQIVNNVGNDIRSGRDFREVGLFEGIVEGFACKFLPVARSFNPEYLGYAMWHCRYIGKGGTLQAVQCLWPDKAGLFPDEVGCHPEIVKLQPLLQ